MAGDDSKRRATIHADAVTHVTFVMLVAVMLVAALGMPYQETWHGRWGNSDR